MCGILAVVSSRTETHDKVDKATLSLSHRGPDGRGVYHDTTVSLGHQRLAVIDPENGAQPMRDDLLTVSFNGMIYNHKDLREILEAHGAQFKTNCDTEVLLHGYRQWGFDGLLDHLNGMFAFTLLDESDHTLYVARDRMGEKPLYYATIDDEIVFASEIKAIVPFLKETRPRIPTDWFVLENTLSDHTLFENVKVFSPGHSMIIRDSKIAHYQPYWQLPSESVNMGDDEAINTLRWLITDSIQMRMQSDVPITAYLSGGLDSSIICCIAKPYMVFHSTYEDEGKFSERDHAIDVAKWTQSKIQEVTLKPKDIPALLSRAIYHLDQPISSSSIISSMNLAQAAREEGFRVVLNGQGADELFGGYGRYVLMQHENNLVNNPLFNQYQGMAKRMWSQKMFDPPHSRYLELNQRVPTTTNYALELYEKLFYQHNGGIVSKMGVADIYTTLQDLIVMDDRACGSVGIESRSPFLDHRIVEFAMRLPDRMKIRDGVTKWILRKVAKGIVPNSIIDRQDKMGMVSPIGRWLQSDPNLSKWAFWNVSKLRSRHTPTIYPPESGDYDRRLHAQVALELWYERFIDNN